VATGRKEGEALLDLPLQVPSCPADQRAEAAVEPELAPMMSDEVEDRADGLPGGTPEPTYTRHEPSVLDVHAEPERAHASRVVDPESELGDHTTRPHVVAGQEV
jgi:hypothetical protein